MFWLKDFVKVVERLLGCLKSLLGKLKKLTLHLRLVVEVLFSSCEKLKSSSSNEFEVDGSDQDSSDPAGNPENPEEKDKENLEK